MKGLVIKSLFLMGALPLCAIKSDPWIPPPYEMNAEAGYAFSYFPLVNGAVNPDHYESFINELDLSINGAFSTNWFCEIDLEFDSSKKVGFNLLSVAPCVKYQLWNDLTGDPMALLVGTYFRYVPDNRLVDVATPYAGSYNFDFLLSVGKEFDANEKMVGRAYALLDVGIATVGAPWLYVDVMGEGVFLEHNFLRIGVDGYFGFGNTDSVDISNFHGWGRINHNSMSVKVGYSYQFSVWGELAFLYKRRVVAVNYPSDLDYYGISYNLSFSF